MGKLYLCGITCGPEIDKIKDLVNKTKDYVDGFIWTVDDRPLTFDILISEEEKKCIELIEFLRDNKKDGEIIEYSWKNAHDWSANEWLHCGVLKPGDWVLMVDSSEIPTEEWIKNIRQQIKELDAVNSEGIYASGRPYLFKYNEYLFFHGTPHWGLYGLDSNKIGVVNDEEKKKMITNLRDLKPEKHYQEHDTKYYLYGRSNIIDAFYGKYGQEKVKMHEYFRRQFRENLREKTGIEPSLKALDTFFAEREILREYTVYEISIIETEFCLSEYYRRTILKEDFMKDIVPRRERWSFKNFIEKGDGFADPNYLGTRLRYDKERE